MFAKLLDDAAVFPPGNFPLDEALERYHARVRTPRAEFVGPLLLPPGMIEPALAQPRPLIITVIGRPAAPLDTVLTAAHAVADHAGHSLVGIEIGHSDRWREVLDLGVPVAVEVPADASGLALLDELADHADSQQVRAKLRTGSTQSTPVPPSTALAAFIIGCHARGLSFKLTGGLHHAVTVDLPDETQFGCLNVLSATGAVIGGADAAQATALLDDRDPDQVAARVRKSEPDGDAIRDLFQSYGCCDVDEPLDELRALGLIEA